MADSPLVATYSIVACDLEAGQWGVAVQSKFLGVGAVVPWAEPEVGAIATQAFANPRYGPDGLALLREGSSAEEAVERLTAADDGRAERQLGIVDGEGRSATFTGEECNEWAGGRAGDVLRGAGEHPRLRGDGRRAGRDLRGKRGQPLSAAAPRLPRRRPGSRRRQQRPAVGRIARRRSATRATRSSRTPSSTCASTTTSGRSRSCAGSTISTGRCSSVSKLRGAEDRRARPDPRVGRGRDVEAGAPAARHHARSA